MVYYCSQMNLARMGNSSSFILNLHFAISADEVEPQQGIAHLVRNCRYIIRRQDLLRHIQIHPRRALVVPQTGGPQYLLEVAIGHQVIDLIIQGRHTRVVTCTQQYFTMPLEMSMSRCLLHRVITGFVCTHGTIMGPGVLGTYSSHSM